MKLKTLTIAALAVLVAVLAVGCSATNDKVQVPTATPTVAAATVAATQATATEAAATNGQLSLTITELATYNGKNGNPAYIAVNGVIYDVTNNKAWNEGQHQGYSAGTDLTESIAKAPHGDSVLKDVPVVGAIKTGA